MAKNTANKSNYSYWRSHGLAYYQSGLSIPEYCAKHKVNLCQMRYYWQRLKADIKCESDQGQSPEKASTLPAFATIALQDRPQSQHKSEIKPTSQQVGHFTLEFSGGIRCHILPDFDVNTLSRLVEALR